MDKREKQFLMNFIEGKEMFSFKHLRAQYLRGWNAAIKASRNASLQSCVVAKNEHDVGCDVTAYEIEKRISKLKPPEEI